jgi:hypothetical protein
MLDDLRKRRDDENALKKKTIRGNSQNRTAATAAPGKTTLGFAGASQMGFTTSDMKGMNPGY